MASPASTSNPFYASYTGSNGMAPTPGSPQASMPFHTSYTGPNGTSPAPSSPQRLALDNLIRRELRVGDPTDPQQVAQALLARYRGNPRAIAIAQEARGLPFLQTGPPDTRDMPTSTSSSVEWQQAVDDVERDLRELLTNNLLKDITPELEGWASAVRAAIAEGGTAARFSLEPRQRDKAFAIRRQLGDYARMARLVGALTPTLSLTYRKFAQSLDEAASVLLVMMGEALANIGFSGGQFLLQVPYTELQVRRDAAIYALRNLVGAAQEAYAPNEWPRGLDAYRVLFRSLEEQGQGDLRALLLEAELARTMDELIQRAEHGRAEGLRALGATAQLDLERFRRMSVIGQQIVTPPSPPLTAFLEALQLFADAFDYSGGFRLMRIARPPILFYGLYGMASMSLADNRLLTIIQQRNLLADRLDCFMQCGCTDASVRCQILLDKILYDVDRAIDLYALGRIDNGIPERRAAAYGYVIRVFRAPQNALIAGLECLNVNNVPRDPLLSDALSRLETELRYANVLHVPDAMMQQELCLQRMMQQRWVNMVTTMAPACTRFSDVFTDIENLISAAIVQVGGNPVTCPEFDITLPAQYEVSLEQLHGKI